MHKKTSLLAIGLLALALSITALAADGTQAPALRTSQEAYQDITNTFGFVPEFLKSYPESGIAGAWLEMKSIQLNPNTALSGKQKELIGLAVAAQIPCRYCIYFHTAAAKAQGATEQELKEAIAAAAITKHWTAIISGNQVMDSEFKSDTDKALAYMKAQMNAGAPAQHEVVDLLDAQAAYKDIESMYGFVPVYFKVLPEEALIGAWRDLREFHFNTKTALSLKDKLLIGLAVTAQTHWELGSYFNTEAAMSLQGATDREIKESVAMAALTAHWSTVLNGSQTDEANFHREVDQILKPKASGAAMKNISSR